MTGLEHTFVALACIGASYYLGYKFGTSQGFKDGYHEGTSSSIYAFMSSIQDDHKFKEDIKVEEE